MTAQLWDFLDLAWALFLACMGAAFILSLIAWLLGWSSTR
jgi:hypothetical protein